MDTRRYRLPAEWEAHKSTILCWPQQQTDWPGKFMTIPWVYGEIVKKLLQAGESVRILVSSPQEQHRARRCLERAHVALDRVEFYAIPTDRGWMRDTSPCFVKQGEKTVAVHFTFNGWAKYDNWQFDRQVPATLAAVLATPLREAVHNQRGVVLEGGAVDGNGRGTVLTTRECLLDTTRQVRNPGFTSQDYEAVFAEYLGADQVIWLNRGIAGDDTHGHVDDLCRFVNRDTVVLCRETNPADDNYRPLEENFEILQSARLEDGSRLSVVSLPMPGPLFFDGVRLPASYANFYIANQAVLVPTFNDPHDRVALNILQDLFPERRVVGIHAVDLVWGLGTIHCLSHEEPL